MQATIRLVPQCGPNETIAPDCKIRIEEWIDVDGVPCQVLSRTYDGKDGYRVTIDLPEKLRPLLQPPVFGFSADGDA